QQTMWRSNTKRCCQHRRETLSRTSELLSLEHVFVVSTAVEQKALLGQMRFQTRLFDFLGQLGPFFLQSGEQLRRLLPFVFGRNQFPLASTLQNVLELPQPLPVAPVATTQTVSVTH